MIQEEFSSSTLLNSNRKANQDLTLRNHKNEFSWYFYLYEMIMKLNKKSMKKGAMSQSHFILNNMRRRNKRLTTWQSHRPGHCRSIQHIQRVSIESVLFPIVINFVIVPNPLSLIIKPDRVLSLRWNGIEFVEKVPSSLLSWILKQF